MIFKWSDNLKNKKYFIMILCIIALFSMQFVCANDNTDNITLASAEDNGILLAPSETKTYTDLKAVIDAASDGDEINLGYNYRYNDGDPKSGINITKNLIINGNGATISSDSQNHVALFNIGNGVTVTLKNLTITNVGGIDWSAGTVTPYRAIYSQGNLNIDDCTFDSIQVADEWNSNFEFSGSVIFSSGDVNIQNSNFLNNVVQTYGTIYTTGTVTARNSYFYNNKAISHEEADGGVIYARYVDIIENCTFVSNVANAGGSIVVFEGNTKIKDSTFDGKRLNEQSSTLNGGAIMSWNSDLEIENSTFANFTSSGDGVLFL